MHMAGSFEVKIVEYCLVYLCWGKEPLHQIRPGYGAYDPCDLSDFFRDCRFDFGNAVLGFLDLFLVEIDIWVFVKPNHIPGDAQASIEDIPYGVLDDCFGCQAAHIESQGLQVFRGLTHSVIGGHDYEGLVEPNLIINELEQISQETINSQDIIFGLKARWAEYVADIVSYGETDCHKIGVLALTHLLGLYQRFGKVCRQLIPEWGGYQ